ncbi:MAG: 50S ribosomal protein L11 methyltransferase [Candidatus Poseidonia sp.]|nr:50S ribosomal protein L11 methyltransferase [Poseidonia sp.]
MTSPPPFDAVHAQRELERLEGGVTEVTWESPTGKAYRLAVPPTVYPPREDTDALARTLARQRLKPGSSFLEIGCGSGAITVLGASKGWVTTACDIHPLAVSATRHNVSCHGLSARVVEGGPGPSLDGQRSQWGGDGMYDLVAWNMPYLPAPEPDEPHLGPLEEASLIDTDSDGLYRRFLSMLSRGALLHADGVAFVVLSSLFHGSTACEQAWAFGLAACVVESVEFDDHERLLVVKIWRPFSGAMMSAVEVVESTNQVLLHDTSCIGTSLRAEHQTAGRGQRGRGWESMEGAFLGSWLVGDQGHFSHGPIDQVRIGASLVRLCSLLAGGEIGDRLCLKWPNDLYVRDDEHTPWKKAGGVLFEGLTRGRTSRFVLGIGLNLGFLDHPLFSSLARAGVHFTPAQLHPMLHALVASHFQSNDGNLVEPSSHGELEAAVDHGVSCLGPLFYRGLRQDVVGLEKTGALHLEGGDLVDDPNTLNWSNVQLGIDRL